MKVLPTRLLKSHSFQMITEKGDHSDSVRWPSIGNNNWNRNRLRPPSLSVLNLLAGQRELATDRSFANYKWKLEMRLKTDLSSFLLFWFQIMSTDSVILFENEAYGGYEQVRQKPMIMTWSCETYKFNGKCGDIMHNFWNIFNSWRGCLYMACWGL